LADVGQPDQHRLTVNLVTAKPVQGPAVQTGSGEVGGLAVAVVAIQGERPRGYGARVAAEAASACILRCIRGALSIRPGPVEGSGPGRGVHSEAQRQEAGHRRLNDRR